MCQLCSMSVLVPHRSSTKEVTKFQITKSINSNINNPTEMKSKIQNIRKLKILKQTKSYKHSLIS